MRVSVWNINHTTMEITQALIAGILPHAKSQDIAKYLPFFQTFLKQSGIDTPQRIGAFFAQIGEESINLSDVTENSSGAEYEGRDDLGNTEPGDGVKFKGRGLIQTTGRSGYLATSRLLFGNDSLLITPSLLEQPEYAVRSAGMFWSRIKNINPVCDMPETWIKSGPHHYNKFQWITILVNGGLNGYDTRLANYNRAKTILNF